MGKSGCLVSCIASAVTMLKEEKTPHTLNEEFTVHNVFDAEGNILWDALRSTGEYEVDVYKEATEELLVKCLKDGRYPIVRVRMYSLGHFHYVLIVKAENGEFYCMDPLEDELTKLSKYGNRIYAVRCVSPAVTVSETAETEAEILTEEDRIDTDDFHESTEAFLTDLDIHPLYAAFLRNEISVPNPFVTGDELSFFDDRKYSQEEHTFENAAKSFSLVDVNHDDVSELVFKIYDYPDALMYILGVQGDKLICYDVHETHTSHMAFGIYDNGIVSWGQNYDGDEDIYYSFDSEGKPYELIHFVREETASDSDLSYDYYYLDGDETAKCILQSNEEYENLISTYKGEEPEWFFCHSFADIPEE